MCTGMTVKEILIHSRLRQQVSPKRWYLYTVTFEMTFTFLLSFVLRRVRIIAKVVYEFQVRPSVRLSVCLHVSVRLPPGGIFVNLDIADVYENMSTMSTTTFG